MREIALRSKLGESRAEWKRSLESNPVEITARHILKTKEKLARILAENCGQDFEVVMADTERDNWKSAEEAKAYGLIDSIVSSRKDSAEKAEK